MIKPRKYATGVLLAAYGIIKIIVGLLDYILNPLDIENLQTNPILKYFVTNDETIAGKLIHYVLVGYGIVTLTHGLSMMGKIDIDFSRVELYIINFLLGFIIFGFYYLVLYTDYSVKKDMKYKTTYVHDLIIGLTFIFFVPCWMIYHYLKDHEFNFTYIGAQTMLLFTCIIWFLLYSAYTLLQKIYNYHSDFLTFLMIPLNTIS
jgi:hypothetical protein